MELSTAMFQKEQVVQPTCIKNQQSSISWSHFWCWTLLLRLKPFPHRPPQFKRSERTEKKDTPTASQGVTCFFFRIFLSGFVRKWAMFSKLAATTFEEPTMTHTAVFAPGFAGHIILRVEMGRPSLSCRCQPPWVMVLGELVKTRLSCILQVLILPPL